MQNMQNVSILEYLSQYALKQLVQFPKLIENLYKNNVNLPTYCLIFVDVTPRYLSVFVMNFTSDINGTQIWTTLRFYSVFFYYFYYYRLLRGKKATIK